MRIGPLRRVIGLLGLVALAPPTWLLMNGALTPEAAAMRAASVLLAVLVIGHGTRLALSALARRFEGQAAGAMTDPHDQESASPRRRAADRSPAQAGSGR